MKIDTFSNTFYTDYMVDNIGILILSLFVGFLAISVAGGNQMLLCPCNLSRYCSESYLMQQEHRLVNVGLSGLLKMSDSNLHDDLVDFDLSESYVNSIMLSQIVLNTSVSVMSSQFVLNTLCQKSMAVMVIMVLGNVICLCLQYMTLCKNLFVTLGQ